MKFENIMKSLLIIIIRAYKLTLSPFLSRKLHCRFHPTCSEFAILALNKYGIKVGSKKAINRLRRCNPYNEESCIDYP